MTSNTAKPPHQNRNVPPALAVVHAMIVGLEGEPLKPGKEPPELSRTASGRVFYRYGKKPHERKKLQRSDFGLSDDFEVELPGNNKEPLSPLPTESDCESSDGEDFESGPTSKHEVLRKYHTRRTVSPSISSLHLFEPLSLRPSTLDYQAHLHMASVALDAVRALSSSATDLSSPVSIRKALPQTPSLRSLDGSNSRTSSPMSIQKALSRTPLIQSLDGSDSATSPPASNLKSLFRASSQHSLASSVSKASSQRSENTEQIGEVSHEGKHKSITRTPERFYRPPEGWNEREMAMSTTAPRVFLGKGRIIHYEDT